MSGWLRMSVRHPSRLIATVGSQRRWADGTPADPGRHTTTVPLVIPFVTPDLDAKSPVKTARQPHGTNILSVSVLR